MLMSSLAERKALEAIVRDKLSMVVNWKVRPCCVELSVMIQRYDEAVCHIAGSA